MKVKNIMFSGFAAAIFAGVCGAADAAVSAVSYELTSREYVDAKVDKKQDKLTAGAGIDITNNVVKTTLDLTPYATTADMETADKDLQDQIDEVKQLTGTEGVAEQISAAVNAEKSAREQADTAIRSDFAAADTALDGKITAEASAREAADTAISNKIGTVADGKTVVEMISDAQTAATYNDTEVRGLISAEATAREQADTAMDTRVSTAEGEIDDLQAADTTIRSDFAAADATTLQSAKDYADGLATNYDAAGSAAAAQAAAEATADAALTAYKNANDPKVNKNTEDIASINAELDTMATSETVTNLTTRVATAEGEIDDLQAADTTIRSEFAAADAATLQSAKDYADANDADTIYNDTQVKADIAANTQAIADEATAREQADATLQGMIEDGDFVSASGILATKGGYLVYSDGAGNITLNQVAVVNGDGTTDIITGESLQ